MKKLSATFVHLNRNQRNAFSAVFGTLFKTITLEFCDVAYCDKSELMITPHCPNVGVKGKEDHCFQLHMLVLFT